MLGTRDLSGAFGSRRPGAVRPPPSAAAEDGTCTCWRDALAGDTAQDHSKDHSECPTVRLRRPTRQDRQLLEAMYERCSRETQYFRFLRPVPTLPSSYLEAVLGTVPGVDALVAEAPSGPPGVIALGSTHENQYGGAEVALLVEDTWQRRGIGSLMLRRLADQARERGVTTLVATMAAEHRWLLRAMSNILGPVQTRLEGATVDVAVPLFAPTPGLGRPSAPMARRTRSRSCETRSALCPGPSHPPLSVE
ncbi:GNAT family N-acetyltransferase [Streptomyces sp. NPDC002668]|uniref:GNAT family N-acetyltransferase n=1 Tax=Streptomyces sp. NPDC002668 TaxID=3154422 RepID=UPI00331A7CE0